MDAIPLQTLKNIKKEPVEELINNLSVQVTAIHRNFKPTVRTRRVEYEPDENVDFDTQFEKELIKIEGSVDSIYLKETLPKIAEELNVWVQEYKNVLQEVSKLNETERKDKIILKESEAKILENLHRIGKVENIKNSLLTEVKKLCLILEKTKSVYKERLRHASENFKDVTHYLQSQIEAERALTHETNMILRKLENNLRDTIYHHERDKAIADVLRDQLSNTKVELHHCQRDLSHQEEINKKSSAHIAKLESQLEEANDRAEFAENRLKRLQRNKF